MQSLANTLVSLASRSPTPVDVQPILSALDACAPEMDGGTGHADALATGSQLDAAEMLRLILGFIADATGIWGSRRKSTPVLLQRATDSLPPSLVTEVFSGTLLTQRHCLNCQETRTVQESFLDLHMSVESGRSLTLDEALAAYFGSQLLTCTCRACGHNQARQSHQLLRAPEVLMLTVKRWDNSSDGISRSTGLFHIKSLDGVSVARFMDPATPDRAGALEAALAVLRGESTDFTDAQRAALASSSGVYDVVAVTCHASRATASGHYLAFARALAQGPSTATSSAPPPMSVEELAAALGTALPAEYSLEAPVEQPWLRFNDETVDVVTPEQVIQVSYQDAYIILMTQRPTPEQESLREAVQQAIRSASGGEALIGGLWLWRLRELVHAGPLVDIDLRCPWCDGLSSFLPQQQQPTDYPHAVEVPEELYQRLEMIYGNATEYHGKVPQPCYCQDAIERQAI